MATIKTLIGNVKGKDGRGYEEVVLYDGNCSACISSDTITASSPMIKLSDSIEKYKSIRIEFISFDGKKNNEGSVSTTITFSVNYIKNNYTFSCIKAFSGDGSRYYSTQGYGFYDDTHLTLCWENYAGWEHNMSHIIVTGIRDKVSDAEKNFNKYSTTEEVVGTWYDKKPLYRKVVKGNITATDQTLFVVNANIDTMVFISGYDCPDGTYYFPFNYAQTGSTYKSIFYKKDTDTIEFRSNSYNPGEVYVVVLEYTKTTD